MFRRAQAWCPDAIRTGYNEAFKRVKLNYPKSYRARHALSVIHDNNGFVELQRTVRTAGNLVDFSDQDEKILFNNWKQRKQKREDLIPYGLQIQEELNNSKFENLNYPLLHLLQLSLKCVAC
ncbi:unnamed protein product [Rhizophagus irregularis]|nr:unnamed protein product [Rhizophagus irregularis]